MYLTTFLIHLLLLLLSYKASCTTNERVNFTVDNAVIKTFVSTTTRYNYQVQIATTNINIVCNSDTESVAWNVALDNGSSYSLNEHTIAINSFSSQKDGVYQCNFGNGVNISISLKGSGHGVYYSSSVEYGTVSIDETTDSQLVLQANRVYRVYCSGNAVAWRDKNKLSLPLCPQAGVCQESLSYGERVLVFPYSEAPREYVCRINFEREDHLHTVQFLKNDSIIPTNISIQTQPYFPLVNGVITVRTLAVTLSCAYVAHPLPGFVKMYSDMPITKTGEYGHTIESRLDYTEHLKEYYVTCYVNNGIARLHMINVIVDLSITSPPSNIASTGVTSSSIGLTWGQASSHLEGNTTYSLSYSANSASVSALYSEAIYSYKLDNLTSCVTHGISIKAINPVGTGPVGSIAVTTLPAVITVAPADINAQSVGSRFILVSWPEIPLAPCPLSEVSYTLVYQSISPEISDRQSVDVETDSRFIDGQLYAVIDQLEEFYTYNVTVYANNSRGEGPAVSTQIRTKPQVPSSTPRYLSLQGRTNLTWSPPAIRHQNGIISHYLVHVLSVYRDRPAVEVSVNTSTTYQVITRDQEAVKIEIEVRAVNQVGEGAPAVLYITLNPYKELPDILKQLGSEVSQEDSKLLLNISLIALEPGTNDTSITPTQTSILVESLAISLLGISQSKEAGEVAEVDSSYFQDILTASSLLWERGILRNEGGSISPSRNFAEFLEIVNELSRLYTAFQSALDATRGRRESTEGPLYNLDSKNLHLNVFPISAEKFRNRFIELEVDLESGLLSQVTIDNSMPQYEEAESLREGYFSRAIHNLILFSESEIGQIRASIFFNETAGSDTAHECVFFNQELHKWDTTGLTTNHLETGTKCGTNHFTSFGVLVRPFKTEFTREQSLALSIVTYILLSISLLLLALSLFLYVATAKVTLKVEGNIVYFNYAIALFLATGTFLFGIQTATNSFVGCFIVSFMMHYTWLSVFAWSLCIAFLLFYKIWFVFSEKRIWYYLVGVGWISPLPIVVTTAGIANANYIRIGEDHCWLSRENGVMWAFIGPILVILVINLVLLLVSCLRIFKSIVDFDKDKLRALRVSITSAAIMIPVLNTPWLLLLFTLDRSTYSIIVEWIFVFLNASNGILFFCLFVLRNNEIKKSLRSTKFVKWLLGKLNMDDATSTSAKVSSKYVLKKQRTTDSYVEQGLRWSASPLSPIGADFPMPLSRPPMKTRAGFVSLPTHDDESLREFDKTQPPSEEKLEAEPVYSKVSKSDTPAETQEPPVGTEYGTQEAPVGTENGTQEAPVVTENGTQEAPVDTENGTQEVVEGAQDHPESPVDENAV